jgi:DNA-binding NtrC family response regulator
MRVAEAARLGECSYSAALSGAANVPTRSTEDRRIQSSQNKVHVCVIDGDSAVRDSVTTLMALNDIEATGFACGGDFLRASHEHDIPYVICEADLPDTTGIELFLTFKPQHPECRFALLLSRSDRATAAVAANVGIDAVFRKPLVNRRLRDFVRRTLPSAELR